MDIDLLTIAVVCGMPLLAFVLFRRNGCGTGTVIARAIRPWLIGMP